MRKFKMICILLSLLLIVGGCSGSNIPFTRKQNIENDYIKFYGFDWLTEVNEITNKFSKDFEEKPFKIENDSSNNYENTGKTTIYLAFLVGTDDSSLKWELADNTIDSIGITCLTNDGCKTCYLVEGSYLFEDKSIEAYERIYNELNTKYNQVEHKEYKGGGSHTEYDDKNGNKITLNYFPEYNILTVIYTCGETEELVKQIDREKLEEEFKKEKEKLNNQPGL